MDPWLPVLERGPIVLRPMTRPVGMRVTSQGERLLTFIRRL